MVYPRRLTPLLTRELNLARIVVLTGMRQVGKTTLIRAVYSAAETKSKIYLDLENPLNQKVFEEENFDNIIANLENLGFSLGRKALIFLDEIQLAPKIAKAVKYLHDNYKIKFFLTGSSSFYLKNLFPESLAGRKVIYELFPLDFEEFLTFKQKERNVPAQFMLKVKRKSKISSLLFKKLFEEYLEFGGFPAVALETSRDRKKQILRDIFTSYFEKDVKSLSDFKQTGKLRDLILLLTGRVGSKLDISKIASEIGISRDTLYSYLNFLEKTYFIFFISPFAKNIDGAVRGAKKIYFCDNGILNYLGKATSGMLLENFAFNNLKKYGQLHYYQKYKGPEVDFILNAKDAFEVKNKAGYSDAKKLKRTVRNLKLKRCYLISKEYSDAPGTIMAQDL